MAIVRNDPFRSLFNLQDQLFRTFDAAYGPKAREEMTAQWSPLVAYARQQQSEHRELSQ